MESKKTSLFENGLIWFGAAVSLAEILTGTYFAPLGFSKGLAAIIIGHIIGCALLFLAGVIGGKTQKSAMDTAKISFGYNGSVFFALLNVIQLVGWTAIMIFDGAIAANEIWSLGKGLWAVVIGALIVVWILVGVKNLGKLNTVAMSALFIFTIVMSFVIFPNGKPQNALEEVMSFGAAVELSVAMPLSWLPLISDYTREAAKPVKASLVSAIVYGFVSIWMYVIGMSAALFTGESDIAGIVLKAGIGVIGLLVVILSTVTTTFLDAYSAGVSSESISKKVNAKWIAVAAAAVGTVGAILLPLDNITDFLYFIGSVFAPMIAIQITDFFLLKRDASSSPVKWINFLTWLIGFIVYRRLMNTDIVLGSTLPSMVITSVVCISASKVKTTKA